MERCLYRSVVGVSFMVIGVVVLILYGYKPNQPQYVYHEELQHNQVKLSNRPVNMEKTKKQDHHIINATHINGILIEPIHASYNRNIYFTVKTTNNNYVTRLLPQMLTWYQVVDKNKVRHCQVYNQLHIYD